MCVCHPNLLKNAFTGAYPASRHWAHGRFTTPPAYIASASFQGLLPAPHPSGGWPTIEAACDRPFISPTKYSCSEEALLPALPCTTHPSPFAARSQRSREETEAAGRCRPMVASGGRGASLSCTSRTSARGQWQQRRPVPWRRSHWSRAGVRATARSRKPLAVLCSRLWPAGVLAQSIYSSFTNGDGWCAESAGLALQHRGPTMLCMGTFTLPGCRLSVSHY